MANHQIPRAAEMVEQLEAPDADGATVRLRVYQHTRAGHTRPEFYVVQYRLTPDGRVDRPSRVTRQFSGARAETRLDTAMVPARAAFADAIRAAARHQTGATR
jgi:hypothetical protein